MKTQVLVITGSSVAASSFTRQHIAQNSDQTHPVGTGPIMATPFVRRY